MPDSAEPDNPQGTTSTAQAARVFISYASEDKGVAEVVCRALEKAGVACWIAPRDVVPGETYAGAIVHAIDSAKLLVLILSEHGAASKHVLREVERASSKDHAVVAFRIDAAPMPADLEYFLNTSQWLDASSTGVEEVLPKLIEAVRRTVAPAPGAAPSVSPSTIARAAPSGATPRKSNRLALALGAVLVIGSAYFAIDKLAPGKHPAVAEAPSGAAAPVAATPGPPAETTIPDKSVAVLPFSDMSEKKDEEYLADGMAEEIIDVLAKVPDLRVPARTSSFYFKGRSEDIHTIAQRLKVAHVLEGSVRTAGKIVRISVQLVRADNGYHLWSETYDRKLDDVFKVEDEIAAEVVKALKVSLLASFPLRADRAQNPQAHSLYLQGLHYQKLSTQEDDHKAVASYEAAIRQEPGEAIYWAQLSRTLCCGTSANPAERKAWSDRALQAAEKALAIDPRLPQSHIARAKVAYYLDLDFPTAVSQIAQAHAIDPTDVDVLEWKGVIAQSQGNLDEAVQLELQSLQLDPLSAIQNDNTAIMYFDLGRYTEAENLYRKALELSPTNQGAHAQTGLSILLRGGDAATALAEIALEPDADARTWSLAMAAQLTGHRNEGDQWLVAKESSRSNPDDLYGAAELHAMRAEADLAFAALDRAYEARSSGLVDVRNDPFLKPLRKDPRFAALLRRLKLPV